jgi:hypothetical protein
MEQYVNNAASTLAADITSSATSLTVASGDGTKFPSSGNFRLLIGTEILIAGARSGDTISSLTRGAEGTAAAAHSTSDAVTHILTAGALDAVRADICQTGADASKAASKAGALYLPSDGYVVYRDTGSALAAWGPLFSLSAPDNSAFTADYNSPTVVTTNGGIVISGAASTDNIRGRLKAVPGSTPYTFEAGFLLRAIAESYHGAGLMVTDGTTTSNKVITVMLATESNALYLKVSRWNSATSFSAEPLKIYWRPTGPLPFLRYTDDGTNRLVSYSLDGRNFEQVFSETRTTHLTATHLGIAVHVNNASRGTLATFLHFKQS